MGTLEIDDDNIIITSHIITYGHAASEAVTERMRSEIESMWNEPRGTATVGSKSFHVIFSVTGAFQPGISETDILGNLDPRNNFFRIEDFAIGNISFVDGLGCNSGYFLLENLYEGSTTAAHEYGHSIGLPHPNDLDLRGKGRPGIMYPRGTLVDPEFQYDPAKRPGEKGGTLNPVHRRVLQQDIDQLRLEHLIRRKERLVLGEFSNVWHEPHDRP